MYYGKRRKLGVWLNYILRFSNPIYAIEPIAINTLKDFVYIPKEVLNYYLHLSKSDQSHEQDQEE